MHEAAGRHVNGTMVSQSGVSPGNTPALAMVASPHGNRTSHEYSTKTAAICVIYMVDKSSA